MIARLGTAGLVAAPFVAACATPPERTPPRAVAATASGVVAGTNSLEPRYPAWGSPAMRMPLAPMTVPRRAHGPRDVAIDVLHCGVCHSDIHQVDNDWKNTLYPCVPGHEIVGRVRAVGSEVRSVAPGDVVAVGAIVDSCGACAQCRAELQQYCEGPKGATSTYNGPYKPDGTNTFGGYSAHVVVQEPFVLQVPTTLHENLAAVPPLLCAGITTYSPLRRWNVGPGRKVAVVGMGGLGHMAVKLAKAMGAEVVVFSSSPTKADDAREFGAAEFVLTNDVKRVREHTLGFDLVIDTIPMNHDVNAFVELTRRDGVFVLIGLLVAAAIDNSRIAFHRRIVTSSVVGGLAETREMLEFCGRHGITATVESIPIDRINEAFPKVQSGLVRYRYVIDVGGSLVG